MLQLYPTAYIGLAAIPVATAGTVAAGAYLNAKYHIVKDLKAIYASHKAQKDLDRASEYRLRTLINVNCTR
jgi:hypothetical protein